MTTFCFCHYIYDNTYISADLFSLLVHVTEFKYLVTVVKIMTFVKE